MLDSFPPPPFEGFSAEAMGFFRGLAEHQEKAWFTEHKPLYERVVQAPLASLVTDLTAALANRHVPLRGDPKRSVFRIHRDVRFSNDKTPYKTHASAVLTRTGDKKSSGLLYIHIDPAGSFMAAGLFHPEPPILQALRERLISHPGPWKKTVAALASAGLALSQEDTLIRPPKGFDDVPPALADAIKLKSWIVRQPLAALSIADAGLVNTIADFAKQAYPLLQFAWTALEERQAPE